MAGRGAPNDAAGQSRRAATSFTLVVIAASGWGPPPNTDLPEGKVWLEIMRYDAYSAHGPVTLCTGYRDTLRIGLAAAVVCATPAR